MLLQYILTFDNSDNSCVLFQAQSLTLLFLLSLLPLSEIDNLQHDARPTPASGETRKVEGGNAAAARDVQPRGGQVVRISYFGSS